MILALVIYSFANGWEIRLALALYTHLKWVHTSRLTLLKTCKNQDSYIRRGFIRLYWYCWKHGKNKQNKTRTLISLQIEISGIKMKRKENSRNKFGYCRRLHAVLPLWDEKLFTSHWVYTLHELLNGLFEMLIQARVSLLVEDENQLFDHVSHHLFKQYRIDYYIYLVALNNHNVNFIFIGLYQSL